MQAAGSVSALFAALVHPRVQRPLLEQQRHQDFIASKLCCAAIALAGAPLFVAVLGVPTPAEAVIFAFALLQMAAAVVVARCGALPPGQEISVAGLLGIGAAALLLSSSHPLCGGAWFVAAGAEALGGSGRPTGRALLGLSLTLVAGAACLCVMAPPQALPPEGMILPAAAALPLLLAAWRGRRLAAAALTALGEERARGAAVVMAGGGVAIEVDAAGVAGSVSPESHILLGITADALAGRGLFEHVQVADRPTFLKLVSDAAHGTACGPIALRLRCDPLGATDPSRVEDAPRHRLVEARAARPARGTGLVLVLREVPATGGDAAAEEAQHLVAEALRSRDDFLATISHELRTPLNAVIGFSEMLASQTLRPSEAEKQREYARIILQSGQHLLSVVNAILDMSKIRSGTFALLPERFDIRCLVEECRDMMRLKAEAGRLGVRFDVPDDIGTLAGDRRACKQILLNLLSNAVKFTAAGGKVVVTARIVNASLRLTVSDTGIGVAAIDLGKLGQPFFQVSGSIRRSFEGTGLGLSVVRGLVDLHGGEFRIASEPGRGTTVEVQLPLEGPGGADLSNADGSARQSRRPDLPWAPTATVAQLPTRQLSHDPRMKRSA